MTDVIYRNFKGHDISLLGMGNMRLPLTSSGAIDREHAQSIIDYAFEHGINYFDTAYMYHGGDSERFLGEALAGYPRESYYLADKFPGFMLRPGESPKEIFEEQLRRCRTDHFDFYLMHAVDARSLAVYEDPRVLDYFEQERQAGRIRYLGFSSHGSPEVLERFVGAREWDFAQIQLNYLDWTLQDAERQYEILTQHGIPVMVMEPLRGGRLASLTPEADALLQEAAPGRPVASWAFRWLMGLENVQVVLSGMSELSQIVDNVATFQHEEPLTGEHARVLERARDMLRERIGVPCTGCRYCVDDCPQGLNIPGLLNAYNNYAAATAYREFALSQALDRLGEGPGADECIACGACARHCPQSIDIPAAMERLVAAAV